MVLWQCQLVEDLARAMVTADPDTGEIFDAETSAILEAFAATLARARTVLEEGLTRDMLLSIEREEHDFARALLRTERQEARQDRQAKKRRELAAI